MGFWGNMFGGFGGQIGAPTPYTKAPSAPTSDTLGGAAAPTAATGAIGKVMPRPATGAGVGALGGAIAGGQGGDVAGALARSKAAFPGGGFAQKLKNLQSGAEQGLGVQGAMEPGYRAFGQMLMNKFSPGGFGYNAGASLIRGLPGAAMGGLTPPPAATGAGAAGAAGTPPPGVTGSLDASLQQPVGFRQGDAGQGFARGEPDPNAGSFQLPGWRDFGSDAGDLIRQETQMNRNPGLTNPGMRMQQPGQPLQQRPIQKKTTLFGNRRFSRSRR